ncbi:hypothetical protein Daura_48565 [Dactylosporangium aurantiacum]|uniref:Abi-like protein n=1 Tax=Dactylosporangium aurantiacum TaxID=35754 RepID=A0A9Q9IVM0_9ACTN|nr:hypothetical protein Daura_48565 [Dactylosporangium aurantiacum]
MGDNNDKWVYDVLSEARLAPYLADCGGDVAAAWHLHAWNIRISAAFFPVLQFVEVALRNKLNRELSARFGRANWWSVAPLNEHGERLVKHALEKVSAPFSSQSANDVVAKLTFGFWVSLISQTYDRTLWVPALHRAFPHYRGRRDVLHAELRQVLGLRNRVMHHEPIHRHDLAASHATIYRLFGYMSSDLAAAVRPTDEVPRVLRLR